jgi:hypothetical protein
MPQGAWENPQAASSLLYAAKFTTTESAIEHGIERGAEGAEAAGVEGAIAGALEGLAEGTIGNMDLWFQNGRVYTFFSVPKSVYDELLAAGSPGSYYNENIRGRYSG